MQTVDLLEDGSMRTDLFSSLVGTGSLPVADIFRDDGGAGGEVGKGGPGADQGSNARPLPESKPRHNATTPYSGIVDG